MPVLVAAILMLTVGACQKARGPTTLDGLPVQRGANTTGDGILAN